VFDVWEKCRKEFTIVPIMVGHLTNDQMIACGKTLAEFWDDPTSFFVISSDFCHWGAKYACFLELWFRIVNVTRN